MKKGIKKVIKKNNKFFAEFKNFALKTNVVDTAVGVIIAAAFGKIVSSLVNDILMPLLGILLGGVNFTELTVKAFDKVTLNYGIFVQNIVDFFIIAFSIFIFVKVVNALTKMTEKKENEPKEKKEEKKAADILLLEEIRDLLKENKQV